MVRTLQCSNFRTFSSLAPKSLYHYSFLISSFSQSSANNNLLSSSMDLCFLDISYKLNLHVFLCLASFIHNVFKVHHAVSFVWVNNIPLYQTHFCLPIHQLMDTGLSHLLALLNKAAMNNPISIYLFILTQFFKWTKWFKHTFLQKKMKKLQTSIWKDTQHH